MVILLTVSHSKYYNLEHLTCNFSDFFPKNIILENIFKNLNEIQKWQLFSILSGVINIGNPSKKNMQILSTIFLRHCERMSFEEILKSAFFFSLADYENEILYKKIIDVIKMQILCIKNSLDGFVNMKNLMGILDTKLLDKLENDVFKNVTDITENLKDFKKIEKNPAEINKTLNTLTKLIWILTYSSIHYLDKLNLNTITELLKDSIWIFNKFISDLNEHIFTNVDNLIDEEIILSRENLNLLIYSYIFFNTEENFNKNLSSSNPEKNTKIKTHKKKITLNLNIEFLKNINISDFDMLNNIDYKKYIIFAKLIEYNLVNKDKEGNLKKHHLGLDTQVKVEDFNFFSSKFISINNILDKEYNILLDPNFTKKINLNENFIEQHIFINQPYEYFNVTDAISGKIKIRREICKKLKINFIEYDFYEFLNYSNIFISDFNVIQENFSEYMEKIDEYINVKNEVYKK